MNNYIIRFRVLETYTSSSKQYETSVYIQSDSLDNAKTTIQNCYVNTADVSYTITFL